jgi:hypothetical protein
MTQRNRAGTLALSIALALAAPTLAWAEDSEGETPPEEQELANQYADLPYEVKVFVEKLQELDRRYPDSADVDMDRLIAEEGESLALSYCAAIGIDGPCAPTRDKEGNTVYAPVKTGATARGTVSEWLQWLYGHSFNIGLIPETNTCPSYTSWTQIHMDDEDRRNANNSWGWVGAIGTGRNTTYRFCKLPAIHSMLFRPLAQSGDSYDYSVVNMGILCPSGARRLIRVEENELWRNANSSSGDIFPNFRIYNTWFNFYCHFDGGSRSILGHMNEFPSIKFPYGVFAAYDMPGQYALAKGRIDQDDEDWWNWNAWWLGGGDHVMWGGSNTSRSLAKVR